MPKYATTTPASNLERELRELAGWYEWGSGPHYPAIAEVLQDAADAVQVHAMSPEVAAVLMRCWQPFVGREAAVGNPPPTYKQAERLDILRYAVANLTSILERAADADKAQIANLLREQIAILERHEREAMWPT